jgi:DNA-binding IclR family transcriptional regulator
VYNKILVLSAIRHLQPRRPDASVLIGDLQEVLLERGVTWERSTVQLYLKRLVNQRVLEQLDRNVYRLVPSDHA